MAMARRGLIAGLAEEKILVIATPEALTVRRRRTVRAVPSFRRKCPGLAVDLPRQPVSSCYAHLLITDDSRSEIAPVADTSRHDKIGADDPNRTSISSECHSSVT
jgi:hypothetical protein